MIEQLINKLRELYGDEYLQTICEHYPRLFEYLIKINYYYLNNASQTN